jgi:hypothetical protein
VPGKPRDHVTADAAPSQLRGSHPGRRSRQQIQRLALTLAQFDRQRKILLRGVQMDDHI